MTQEYKPKVERLVTEPIERAGHIRDYVSNEWVKRTPEQVEAKQLFAKRLVEEYGYSKDQIQTLPEFYITKGSMKIGPADIVVFRDNKKTFDNIYLIIETKRKDKKDGENQLKSYIDPTPAQGGVWFNGDEIAYYRAMRKPPSYTPELVEWRNIPKKGQSWEEIGQYKTGDELVPAQNLKSIFKVVYYHLYTNSNLPRAERLGGEMTRLIFCKIYDEIHNDKDLKFKAGAQESDEKVSERIKGLFGEVKRAYQDVFEQDEKLLLDNKSIGYVVSQLQNYSLQKTDKDAIGDAFEVFIGPTLRGEKGQFFTPRNLVRICAEILDPKPEEKVIDPACGSGGFLIVALEHVWKKIEEQYKHLPKEKIGSMQTEVASKNFYGIDKEFDLAKVSKAYMAIVGDGRGGIFCSDSLVNPTEWMPLIMRERIKLNSFDVLLTNPPFGSKIPITDKSLLEQYELGFQWKKDKQTGKWQRTDKVLDKQVPQILFIERCLQLLRPGGRMAIVLPETYLHAVSSQHILQFLRRYKILHVVDLAHDTFRPDNNAKTVIVVLEKSEPVTDYETQFSIAHTIGHDHTGRTLYKIDPTTHQRTEEIDDDIPHIINKIKEHKAQKSTPSPLLFSVKRSEINPKVLVPRYYWRDYLKELEEYARENDCELVSMGDIYKEGIIKVYDGHGSPDAVFKGTGEIPYIRVADIINWEVYKNPTALIPKGVYLKMKGRGIELEVSDLLFVRRGSYRIGSVALISPFDKEVLLTKEILIFRVTKTGNELDITPYYLIYLLSSPVVQRQIEDKVLIETTLPNIADRWQELLLPISKNRQVRHDISEKVQNAFELKWKAVEEIKRLQEGRD